MTGTTTIYSQIVDVAKMDDIGLEVSWTDTAVGSMSVLVSNSGNNFNALTFDPPLPQPSGASAGYFVSLNLVCFKYIMLKYTNTSGTGTLTVYGQNKDLN